MRVFHAVDQFSAGDVDMWLFDGEKWWEDEPFGMGNMSQVGRSSKVAGGGSRGLRLQNATLQRFAGLKRLELDWENGKYLLCS
jgi:hypothetical protein